MFSVIMLLLWFVASQEVKKCIQHSEAALEVSRKLYEETGVYLLAGLITDRERLAMEIDQETSPQKLRSIKDQLDGKICSQHLLCLKSTSCSSIGSIVSCGELVYELCGDSD